METNRLLGISACLMGKKVRYDGDHRQDTFIIDTLGKFVDFVPVCPEVECGLGVPREAMRLVGDQEDPRMVTIHTHIDHTERMKAWACRQLAGITPLGLRGFIFKSNSPSCGLLGVDVYDEKGLPTEKGTGLFAREFINRFPQLPVIDEIGFQNRQFKECFIARIRFASET
ncbi:MAG: DUF523 domain-containing protein [Deltaproteobacteria bacterium]|nr:DUF523 domain-containing protein [Deltaproteobacteria bacterium]